jgi:hypothetical protein
MISPRRIMTGTHTGKKINARVRSITCLRALFGFVGRPKCRLSAPLASLPIDSSCHILFRSLPCSMLLRIPKIAANSLHHFPSR